MTWVGRHVCGAALLPATQGNVEVGTWPARPFICKVRCCAVSSVTQGGRARARRGTSQVGATSRSLHRRRTLMVRGKHNDTAKDERKRQRRAAFFLASQGDTEAGT